MKYSRKGEPHYRFVYLSTNEKKISWYSKSKCSGFFNEKSILVDDLEMVYMGRKSDNFQKFNIDPSLEQNCISLVFKGRSLDLRNDDDSKCRKWFKSFKYLLMKVKSKQSILEGNIKYNQTKKFESSHLSESTIFAIWNTEILPNWGKYRKLVIPQTNYIGENKMKVKFTYESLAEKIGIKEGSSKTYFESGKYDFNYVWSLGIPAVLRKKVWSLTIGNRMFIDGALFDSLIVPEVDFKKAIESMPKHPLSHVNLPYITNEENWIEDEVGSIYSSEIEKIISGGMGHFISHIIADSITLSDRFYIVLQKIGIDKSKFMIDIYRGLQKFSLLRPDISYSKSIAIIFANIYLNSESCFHAFSNFVNLIFSDKASFLFKFWDKDEYFIKIKTDYFEYWLKALCPDVYSHFENMEISIGLYFFYWVENLFAETFEFEFLVRVWDMLLLKGEVLIYELALAIIKYQEKELPHFLINDIIEKLNRPPISICNQILELVINGEINLSESFKVLLEEESLGYEKGLLLKAFMIEDDE